MENSIDTFIDEIKETNFKFKYYGEFSSREEIKPFFETAEKFASKVYDELDEEKQAAYDEGHYQGYQEGVSEVGQEKDELEDEIRELKREVKNAIRHFQSTAKGSTDKAVEILEEIIA